MEMTLVGMKADTNTSPAWLSMTSEAATTRTFDGMRRDGLLGEIVAKDDGVFAIVPKDFTHGQRPCTVGGRGTATGPSRTPWRRR
jgi:hypothetical protein